MSNGRVNLYLLCILDFKNPLNIIWLFNMLLFRVVLINYTLLANKVTQGQTRSNKVVLIYYTLMANWSNKELQIIVS